MKQIKVKAGKKFIEAVKVEQEAKKKRHAELFKKITPEMIEKLKES